MFSSKVTTNPEMYFSKIDDDYVCLSSDEGTYIGLEGDAALLLDNLQQDSTVNDLVNIISKSKTIDHEFLNNTILKKVFALHLIQEMQKKSLILISD